VNREEFHQIADLKGIDFTQALLALEQRRFEPSTFRKESTLEEVNSEFGIFPAELAYPVYFAGDVREPQAKTIFLGLNPGYNEARYQGERQFLQEHGLFNGYCRLYSDYFKPAHKSLLRYYSNIGGFLRRLRDIHATIDWDWFQENFIALEFIPYHSSNTNGLRINDASAFREVYIEILLKLLDHLNPHEPVFVNGFPTVRRLLSNNSKIRSEFADVIEYEQAGPIWSGRLGRHELIGLPFLTWPKSGFDALVEAVRLHWPDRYCQI
jgi:hypothetical protein